MVAQKYWGQNNISHLFDFCLYSVTNRFTLLCVDFDLESGKDNYIYRNIYIYIYIYIYGEREREREREREKLIEQSFLMFSK